MKDQVAILCCRNLQPEIMMALEGSALQGVRVIIFDPHSNDPQSERLTESQALERHGDGIKLVMVLGCGCLYFPTIPEQEGTETLLIGRGAELFLPPALVEHFMRKGSYIVTPGWLRDWRTHIEREGEAVFDMLTESVQELVLIDTGTVTESEIELKNLAENAGLPYSVLPVGVDQLRLLIESNINKWMSTRREAFIEEARTSKRRVADYAMVFDLLGEITVMRDESELIDNVLDTYRMLFSPREVCYAPLDDEGIPSQDCEHIKSAQAGLKALGGREQMVTPEGNGFLQCVRYKDSNIGLISVEGLAFPKFINEYLQTSQFITSVLGLAIFNSRTYDKLNQSIVDLESEINERTRAERELALANNKLNLLSGITRHDTLNQITVLQGYLELMGSMVDDERLQRYTAKMDSAIECMMELITFTKEYELIGIRGATWLSLDTIISELDAKGLSILNRSPGLEVHADPLLDRVFYNLIDNTVRHSGSASEVLIDHEVDGDDLILRWCDNGQGVPDADKSRIFEKGVGRNTGYGLFLIKEILGITGADIVEDGIYGQGARFSIRIPSGQFRFKESQR